MRRSLAATNTRFPERSRSDADHAWLTPVKASTDSRAIDQLVRRGIVEAEFVADVLALDFTNPVFSPVRCSLLRLVPSRRALMPQFQKSLAASSLIEAQLLLRNLEDPERTAEFHQEQAKTFLATCDSVLQTRSGAIALYRVLAQRRTEALGSEISKHPGGQIMEPGFRVVFPRVLQKQYPASFSLPLIARFGELFCIHI
jgi:hypothetical protein